MNENRPIALSIVVAVFNEIPNVRLLYAELKAVLDALGHSYEILFVDDGSCDGTREELEALFLDDPYHLRVILLKGRFGQTAALAAGFDHARGEIVITMDGDLQNDPTDIPQLLQKLEEGYDIVSGWRKDRKDPLVAKKLPSLLSNRLASWLTGIHLHDFGCTLKAYRREVLAGIKLYGELHRYIPALANAIGARIAEIEVRHRPRAHGKTKYRMNRLMRGLLDLVTVKLLLSYSTRPMQIFGGIGLLVMVMALLAAAATVLMKIFMGTDITGNPLLYITILFVITSLQFISLGFLAELIIRTYHETQEKPIYVVGQILEHEVEERSGDEFPEP